ncbi:MAG: hypothetical protein ACI8UO_000049 [Verrucomicrobiales bacterium]|jgi:hypothetical protein
MKPNAYLLLLVAVIALSGCLGRNRNAAPPQEPADTGVVEPIADVPDNSFLFTGYEPLERWMEERFKVRYENMPLKMVFDQQPISDIRYQHMNLAEEAPVFQLISPSISRREILQEVSRFYNLEMNVQMVDGKPSFVVVRARNPGEAVNPGAGPAPNASSGAPAPDEGAAPPNPSPQTPPPAPAPAGATDVPVGGIQE